MYGFVKYLRANVLNICDIIQDLTQVVAFLVIIDCVEIDTTASFQKRDLDEYG